MAPAKKSSSAKAPAKKPMHVKKHVVPAAPKSQYEIERDERIKRNEAFMLSLGINPHGSGYLKENKKSPPKPRGPKKYARVPAPPLAAPRGRDGRARAPDLRQLVGR